MEELREWAKGFCRVIGNPYAYEEVCRDLEKMYVSGNYASVDELICEFINYATGRKVM